MSWYGFRGPVQGGYGGLAESEEQRRRRRHYRDAGAPYSSGASSGGPLEEGSAFTKIPSYWTQVAAKPQGVPDPIKPGVHGPPDAPQPERGPPEVGVPGPRIDPIPETDPRARPGRFQPLRPAPRQAAAVDFGDGPVQDFRERAPTPDLAQRMGGVPATATSASCKVL